MYDVVTQRIKDIIDDRFNGNVSALAKELGHSSPQKLNRLFLEDKRNGNYPVASIDILTEISNKLDYSLDYLVKGVEENKPKMRDDKYMVPYFDIDVTASIVGSFNDIKEDPEFYIDFKPFNDCTAYFPIYGDSMYPRFSSGEIIAVKEVVNRNTIQWGEAHMVITDSSENNMKTVKTIHPCKDDNDCVILRATNPDFFGDTKITKKSILGLFIVKGKIRRDQL